MKWPAFRKQMCAAKCAWDLQLTRVTNDFEVQMRHLLQTSHTLLLRTSERTLGTLAVLLLSVSRSWIFKIGDYNDDEARKFWLMASNARKWEM